MRNNTIVFELQRNFDVTTPLAGRQDDTAAIARTDSGVAITWQRQGVQGPLLLTPTSGTPVFVEQFVASGTADFNATPAIATQRGGGSDMVVAWLDGTLGQVKVQLHNSNGTRLGTAAVVATNDGLSVQPTAVVAANGGGFSLPAPVVPTNGGGSFVSAPVVAWLAGGLFAVAWASSQTAPVALGSQVMQRVGSEVMMRLYVPGPAHAPEPVPLGAAFQVNSTSAGFQDNVSLTATPRGGVVAAWTDSGADGSGRSVRLQAFDSAGQRIGGEYRVSVEEDGELPDIAALADGRVVVTWETISGFNDPNGTEIRTQIIDPRQGVITGSTRSETLYGNDLLADEILGLDGNDTLMGLKGNDTLVGGGGNDRLVGGEGDDTLVGGAGDDRLEGDEGHDQLLGGAGSDRLLGGDGDDTLVGGDGNDRLEGGDGNDKLEGGAGNDELFSGDGDDTLVGGDGNDTLSGGGGNNELLGGAGNDRLIGGREADIMRGGSGDDVYDIDATDDVLELAGEGNDTILDSEVSVDLSVNFANFENVLLFGSRALTAGGNAGANVLDGSQNSAANVLTGRGGDDIYVLGVGDTAVEVAGGGSDTIRTSRLNVLLSDFTSIENVELTGADALTATGTAVANVLNGEGNSAANILTGLGGNDTYILGSGDRVVEAVGGGTDTVSSATISLNLGNFANVENITLLGALPLAATGNASANTLDGEKNSAANALFGLGGSDIYIVGLGDTIGESGTSIDQVRSSTISLDLARYGLVENLMLLGALPLSGTGTAAANTLDGSANTAANVLTGLGGNDFYVVGVGDTVVEAVGGGLDLVMSDVVSINLAAFANVENAALTGSRVLSISGSDLANGMNGANNSAANILTGLGGDDIYILGVGDTAIEAPGGGTDGVQTSVMDIDLASFLNVENIMLTGTLALKATGSAADNVLTGNTNSAANILTGLGGNDTYFVGSTDVVVEVAGGGVDTVMATGNYTLPALAVVEALRNGTTSIGLTLTGNAFSQNIVGAAGNDILSGGGGGDSLVGNGGTDTLIGGLGADRFDFLVPSDSAVGAGRDSVIGFVAAQGDRIDLSAIDDNTLLAGDQGFIFRGTAAFTGARGEIRLVPAGADVIVQGTIAGTVPAFEIRVAGVTSLLAGDFTL
ncbi:MAG: calcium-binding protein [Alphaproteobacteria bacterium]|nr:calcium-binding protein [Alphaproteobacteria bacterium]